MFFLLQNTLYMYIFKIWKFFCDPCLIENGIVVSGDLALFVMTLEKLFRKNFAQSLQNHISQQTFLNEFKIMENKYKHLIPFKSYFQINYSLFNYFRL